MALTSPTYSPYEQDLCTWANRFMQRFPKHVDSRLMKGVYAILGPGTSSSFLKERSFLHLKRLLMTQFLMEKKMEENLSEQKAHPLVRIFPIESILCIAITYRKQENTLKRQTILEIANQKIPTLRKIDSSFYQWESQEPSYNFCYIELEKMRGKSLLISEVKGLESYMKKELSHYLSETSIFWPYNHEEAFKQVLTLANEICSEKDSPQVSIHFQKQTSRYLEFLVCLARPKITICQRTTINDSHFPSSIRLIPHISKEIERKISTLIEVFSLLVPLEICRNKETIDVLYAREFVVRMLETITGEIRDYNGGLFETKKNRFREICNAFSGDIPSFLLFGEKLFYSLKPIEAQICLSNTIFKHLLEEVAHVLEKPAPFFSQSGERVAVFKFKKSDQIDSYLKKAEMTLNQGKITSYAHFETLNRYYVCLIDEQAKNIGIISEDFLTLNQKENDKKLHLAFNFEDFSSLDPYYLCKEFRGRVIARLLYEPLFRLHPQKGLVHGACEDMKVSKDGKRYLFKLRAFHWVTGEQVTAFDYEKTWKRNFLKGVDLNMFYILKNAEAIKNKKKSIDELGVKAIDQKHLEVKLENRDPSFLEKLAYVLFFPLPRGSSSNLTFNGPFFLTRKNDNHLHLERNPYYWDKEGVFFEEVEASFGHSSKKVGDLFKQKKIDWIGACCSLKKQTSQLRLAKKVPFYFFIYLNTEILPLSSPFIRQALSCVINRQEIIDQHFPKSTPLFCFPNTDPCEVDKDYDPVKAKMLFEKGLTELGLTRENFPSLMIISSNSKHKDLSLYLKKKWESAFQIGIKLDSFNWDNFYKKIERGHFHIGGFFKYSFPKDPIPFLDNFNRKEDNFSHWEHPEYSKVLRSLKKTTSSKTRTLLIKKASHILQSHTPFIPLFSLNHRYSHRTDLKNYVFNDDGSLDFRFAFFANTSQSTLSKRA